MWCKERTESVNFIDFLTKALKRRTQTTKWCYATYWNSLKVFSVIVRPMDPWSTVSTSTLCTAAIREYIQKHCRLLWMYWRALHFSLSPWLPSHIDWKFVFFLNIFSRKNISCRCKTGALGLLLFANRIHLQSCFAICVCYFQVFFFSSHDILFVFVCVSFCCCCNQQFNQRIVL